MTKKFNLEDELNGSSYPKMFIAGLKYYIEKNNCKITSKKDLDKIIKEYGEL